MAGFTGSFGTLIYLKDILKKTSEERESKSKTERGD